MGLRSLFKSLFSSSPAAEVVQKDEEVVWEAPAAVEAAAGSSESNYTQSVVDSQITDSITVTQSSVVEAEKPKKAKKITKKTANKVTTKKKSSVSKKK
jgi:hypothetical protein